MSCVIYKLKSPSGKYYIGQTTLTFEQRMYKHKSAGKHKLEEGCVALNASIHKYGWDNFEKEVLLYCNEEHLDDYETKFIELYGSLAPGGYNLTTGGSANKHMSETTKIKMKESALARESAPYRKYEETAHLPKFMTWIENEYQSGYKISKHPKCSSKYFTDKEKTLEENYADAMDFMNKLNLGEVEVVIPPRELPDGIQKSGDGFRVRYKDGGKTKFKCFKDKNNTKEANLELAIQFNNTVRSPEAECKSAEPKDGSA
nr:GIY-YIG catalytic domain-containing endonuclease [Kaumoebavirus]